MALIIMAVHDTEENKRSEYTVKTLQHLLNTNKFNEHRLIVVDNDSCEETKTIINSIITKNDIINVITNKNNIGTAEAINQGVKQRREGEYVIKIDNDVVISKIGWVDDMEEAMKLDQNMGILGLKRKDLEQNPYHENPNFRSELVQLPHTAGEKWRYVEVTNDIMGTCTMFSPQLLDKIGYMRQIGVYGFDDTLMSLRSRLAGFYNAFLIGVDIDHIDKGDNPYIQWKENKAAEAWEAYQELHTAYVNGDTPIHYNPYEN